MDLIKKVARKVGLTPNSSGVTAIPMNSVNTARLLFMSELVSRTRGVPGDIVECGVGMGRSLLTIALQVKLTQDSRNIWGFDSFEGFPEPSTEDNSPRNPQKGDYTVPMTRVMRTLTHYLADDQFVRSKITLVKGYFEDSLSRYPQESISLMNLDVDLHDSYKTCLERLYPLVSVGGIISFDEFIRESDAFPGAEKAIREFFQGKNVKFEKDPYFGKFFVTKLASN